MDFLGPCLLLAVYFPEAQPRMQPACTSLSSTHSASMESKRVVLHSIRLFQDRLSVGKLQFLDMVCFPKPAGSPPAYIGHFL